MPMREQPRQTYFPSARLRLIVRLEDFDQAQLPPAPARPPQLRRGTGRDEAPLRIVERDGVLVLEPKSGDATSTGGPQEQTTSSDDLTFEIAGIVPIAVNVGRNGIRTASTLSADLRFRDLPIDPRVVRACAVEFYLGTVSEEDFKRGVSGGLRATPGGAPSGTGGSPLHLVPDTYQDRHGRTRTNLRFQGWVDEWSASWPDDDEPIVHIECTDNTRLLIDQGAPPQLVLDAKIPLDRSIATYLSNFPQFRGLGVEYRPAGGPIPMLEEALARTAFRPRLGPGPGGGGDKMTVWDFITDVCGSVGHTVRIENTTIVIQRARTLYSNAFSGRPDDPFTGRTLPSGRVLTRRLMVYGRNIADMEFKRKFSRGAPTNIEVRCYHGRRKKTLVARFPDARSKTPGTTPQTRPHPGNANEQKWLVIRVRGVQDEATLRIVAQSIYESFNRNELQVSFTTKSLATFGGDNLDPDALDLMPGDAIDVEINREATEITTAGFVEDRTATAAEEFLKGLGYSPAFAAAYSKAATNIGVPVTFRVKKVGLDWSNEEGVTIDVEAVNYIEVRADRVLPTGEEIEPEDTAGVSPVTVVVDD
jgi:hypothetical protein